MDLPQFKNTYFLVDKKNLTQLSLTSNSTYHLGNPSIISYRSEETSRGEMQKHESSKMSNILMLKQFKSSQSESESQINLQKFNLEMHHTYEFSKPN